MMVMARSDKGQQENTDPNYRISLVYWHHPRPGPVVSNRGACQGNELSGAGRFCTGQCCFDHHKTIGTGTHRGAEQPHVGACNWICQQQRPGDVPAICRLNFYELTSDTIQVLPISHRRAPETCNKISIANYCKHSYILYRVKLLPQGSG